MIILKHLCTLHFGSLETSLYAPGHSPNVLLASQTEEYTTLTVFNALREYADKTHQKSLTVLGCSTVNQMGVSLCLQRGVRSLCFFFLFVFCFCHFSEFVDCHKKMAISLSLKSSYGYGIQYTIVLSRDVKMKTVL